MNSILKYLLLLLLCIGISFNMQAQNKTKKSGTHKSVTKKTTITSPTPKPAAPVKEVTITLKNLCEGPVPIFAGPKEELKHPTLKVVGGSSTNTLYLKTNQVVCITSADGKTTKSCANVSASHSQMEVNSSGTVVVNK